MEEEEIGSHRVPLRHRVENVELAVALGNLRRHLHAVAVPKRFAFPADQVTREADDPRTLPSFGTEIDAGSSRAWRRIGLSSDRVVARDLHRVRLRGGDRGKEQ